MFKRVGRSDGGTNPRECRLPTRTVLELAKSWASSSQTGAIFLQWPHHGAKNLTKACNGEDGVMVGTKEEKVSGGRRNALER